MGFRVFVVIFLLLYSFLFVLFLFLFKVNVLFLLFFYEQNEAIRAPTRSTLEKRHKKPPTIRTPPISLFSKLIDTRIYMCIYLIFVQWKATTLYYHHYHFVTNVVWMLDDMVCTPFTLFFARHFYSFSFAFFQFFCRFAPSDPYSFSCYASLSVPRATIMYWFMFECLFGEHFHSKSETKTFLFSSQYIYFCYYNIIYIWMSRSS